MPGFDLDACVETLLKKQLLGEALLKGTYARRRRAKRWIPVAHLGGTDD